MYANLRWLEQRLVRDFPQWQQDRPESPRVLYKENYIIANYSTYYWNDMLRRIGLSIYAPRLMEAGRTMRALEVINYAENCLFCATGNSYMQDNHFGYLFQALDTRKAKFTLQYINHLQQHRDTLAIFSRAIVTSILLGSIILRVRSVCGRATLQKRVPYWHTSRKNTPEILFTTTRLG